MAFRTEKRKRLSIVALAGGHHKLDDRFGGIGGLVSLGIYLQGDGIVHGLPTGQQFADFGEFIPALQQRPVLIVLDPAQNSLRPGLQADDISGAGKIGNVVGIEHDSTAGRNDQIGPSGQFLHQSPLDGPERGLAAVAENLRDGAALAANDFVIHVDKIHRQFGCDDPSRTAFARAHETDEDNVILRSHTFIVL